MPNPYAGPIIDAHHHLWDLSLGRHPWLAATAGERGGLGELGPLRRNYLPQDYLRDAGRHDVVATVHVEAGWAADDGVGETRWLESLGKSQGVASRYVVHVPLAVPQAPALLEAQAAFGRVVGVRDILSWDPDPTRRFAARDGIIDDPAWRSGLGLLARHGLSFDLMVFPRQLADAARLAAAFPDQQFVLNHCGSPIDRDAEGMRTWRDGLRLLARRDNVAIKISDLVAYDHDWTLDSLRPVVLHCIECFGTSRAMFGSDFPVAGMHASFDEVYDSFKAITADLSKDEQTALFFGNARRIYRLDEVSSTGLFPA
ncbi:hydrolase [Mesorhizobium sp. M1C.F.Ca.ET.193.01.1.1]|uniref:amidohydrolase family protein n=2 Tax=Mesorhizobium TaxID=68287 RepID=UPI000FD3BF91|nr:MULTISPECIES: amidohydrolase family protein [unclassified Mesorhizobium]TGS93919.1 hydrolase [bacterium M00.F.Ca.ET.177.01.1.1]RWA74935.1 MAG: hydrolase [Mesorhizobium sp.]RWC02789.1 MAG: hydrolase [Mesorhizobium sp.]RWG81051.1 MAG: hydrolase [Mesorhizobium sp.]RWG89689.1 MAG: hydrolase [Mesorhizobium sp.]